MTGVQIAMLVGAILGIDAVIMVAIFRAIRHGSGLAGLGKKYPATEPLPGAVSKPRQSFAVGAVKLGSGVTATVDERHLHLTPAKFISGITGMRPMSIPWEAIKPGKKPKDASGRAMVVIEGVDVRGPEWCLSLARGESA